MALKKIKKHWQLYLVILPPLVYLFIFKYVPMYGAIIAFKNFSAVKGILGSDWAGLKYFKLFIYSPNFWTIFKNTVGLGFYNLLVSFPAPILLALALNELAQGGYFKKAVQMITFAPYFISNVVMVSIIIFMLSPRIGPIDLAVTGLGLKSINFMGEPWMFKSIFVWSDVWQFTGYGAIIYIAALAGINPELYEAARVDGASRFQKIKNVDFPGIAPAIVIILVLNTGAFMNVAFEKIFLMQNPLNLSSSEVISTYVYKVGLLNGNFSFSAAVGLFNSVINLALLVAVNYLARKFSDSSLW